MLDSSPHSLSSFFGRLALAPEGLIGRAIMDRGRHPAYLRVMQARGTAMPGSMAAMMPRFSRPLAVVTAVVVLLLAGTVALWAHYGTAVFYETILAGLAACF
jgi:hypothetical protein